MIKHTKYSYAVVTIILQRLTYASYLLSEITIGI